MQTFAENWVPTTPLKPTFSHSPRMMMMMMVMIMMILLLLLLLSILRERLSVWNMLNCAEQMQIQNKRKRTEKQSKKNNSNKRETERGRQREPHVHVHTHAWKCTHSLFFTVFVVLMLATDPSREKERDGRGEKNVHRPGIEPGSPAWQASILPLDHRC